MARRKKAGILSEFLKLRKGMIFDRGDEIFGSAPDTPLSALQDLGLTHVRENDPHVTEERNAIPENRRQHDLVAYFEADGPPSETVLNAFLEERCSAAPNLPLIRRYFRKANQPLGALLLFALDRFPTDTGLLDDLALLHEFENILEILISRYMLACELETDPEAFGELARDFHRATEPDGYDALYALKERFAPGTLKRKIVEMLMEEHEPAGLPEIPAGALH